MSEQTKKRILLTGGAGLVGQNLVIRLKERGYDNIVVLDKNRHNLSILKSLHPEITTEVADLSRHGNWENHFEGVSTVVMLHAQIGGLQYEEFERNNIIATSAILDTMEQFNVSRLVHISSSVLYSIVDDYYSSTKRAQEALVTERSMSWVVLRPTLMFGWFDRKHLGWLSRFMQRVPVFPIPGDGRYMRQPLYVGDFCKVIIRCIEDEERSGEYNISGLAQIDYIDIIRQIRSTAKSRAFILKLPYHLFYFLLWLWARFDSNPPFTTQQLAALVADDDFEVTDWPSVFGVPCTPFSLAIEETFNDSRYSNITLEF